MVLQRGDQDQPPGTLICCGQRQTTAGRDNAKKRTFLCEETVLTPLVTTNLTIKACGSLENTFISYPVGGEVDAERVVQLV